MARRINLLPQEIRQRRRARQALAAVVAGGVALVALLAIVYGVQEVRLRGERDRLERQEEVNAGLRRETQRLVEFEELEGRLAAREKLLADLTFNEVRWSVILADISMVIPNQVWLTDFNGTVSPAPLGTTTTPVTGFGTLNFGGNGFAHLDVAKWLTKLAGVKEFFDPYLSVSTKSGQGDAVIVTFTSNTRLSNVALRRSQRGAERKP